MLRAVHCLADKVAILIELRQDRRIRSHFRIFKVSNRREKYTYKKYI